MSNAEGSEPNEQINIDVREVETVLADGTVIDEIDVREVITEHPGHGHGGGHHPGPITVTVNRKYQVELDKSVVTGLEVKQAAIAQGVPIQLDFKLSVEHGDGKWKVVRDEENVRVTEHTKFLAVTGDVNS